MRTMRQNLFANLFIAIIVLPFTVSAQDCSPTETKLVKIGGGHYVATLSLWTSTDPPPDSIRFDAGDLFYKVGNLTYAFYKNAESPSRLRYAVSFPDTSVYVDSYGNRVSKINGTLRLSKFDDAAQRTWRVVTERGWRVGDVAVDADRDRVVFVGYDADSPRRDAGRLYGFETGSLDERGGKIVAAAAEALGGDVTKLSVDRRTGDVAFITALPSNRWSVSVMKPIAVEPCKTPKASGINKQALMSSIQIASEQIVKLYEDAVLGREESEVLRRRADVRYPNAGSVKPSPFPAESSPLLNNRMQVDGGGDVHDCGTQFTLMNEKIGKLEAALAAAKGELNDLYGKIYFSDAFKRLKEVEEGAGVDFVRVGCNSTEKLACYEENAAVMHEKAFMEVKDVVKNTVDWLNFVYDFNVNNESIPNIINDIHVRFSPSEEKD